MGARFLAAGRRFRRAAGLLLGAVWCAQTAGAEAVRARDGMVVASQPDAARADLYLRAGVAPDASLRGGLAVATPGFVPGLALALAESGTLPWARVLEPAIRLAEEGFAIGPYHARMLAAVEREGWLDRPHAAELRRIQFPPPGVPVAAGWRLRQPELAGLLRTLAREGAQALQRGPLAEAIVASVQRAGGILALEDLLDYRPKYRDALRGEYRGLEVLAFPPPSSGGVALIEMLQVLEGIDGIERGAHDPAGVHRIVETMRHAFADRALWLGDPDFVEVPVARLLSREHAAAIRRRVEPPFYRRWPWQWGEERTQPIEEAGLALEDAGTAHLSVADAQGGAVALTMTINTSFGSGISVPGLGLVLNNEMDDFAKAPGVPNAYGLVDRRGANAIAPGKRPLSSMTPTILVDGDRPFLVTGSPGGPRIITTVLHTILGVVDAGLAVDAALAAPRYHHQWLPPTLFVEPGFPSGLERGLRERGHTIERAAQPWSNAQALVFDAAHGVFFGGSDPRGDGVALGYDRPLR